MKTWELMREMVKTRLENEGRKQKYLAQQCGYDEKTFSVLISGRRRITDVDIRKFCAGMGIMPNTLLGE